MRNIIFISLVIALIGALGDTEVRNDGPVDFCTYETSASGECTGLIPTVEDIAALRAELKRTQDENIQLRASLAQAKLAEHRKQPIASASSSYPYPPGECIHPPHFQFLDKKGAIPSQLPTNRSAHRLLTDPHGLTLNLEFVSRGESKLIGDLPTVVELTKMPTEIEFLSQYVMMSRPFVVRGAVANWTAFNKWTDDYLIKKIGKIKVEVRRDKHRDQVFHYNREAAMTRMTMKEFIEATQTEEERVAYLEQLAKDDAAYEAKTGQKALPKEVYARDPDRLYLAQAPLMWRKHMQPLSVLCQDLEGRCPQPEFTKGLNAKSINMWYGKGNKTVILHYDNNEGIMAMMSGYKNFTLYSPSNRNYLYPMVANEHSAVSSLVPDAQIAGTAPFDYDAFPCFAHARPVIVTIGPGDLFYLPAYWYHRVHSYGRSLGINWWFSTHSLLLQQMMKTIDLNVDVTERNGTVRPQKRW